MKINIFTMFPILYLSVIGFIVGCEIKIKSTDSEETPVEYRFEVGDVVVHKTDPNIDMVIYYINENASEANRYQCEWMDRGGNRERDTFSETGLMLKSQHDVE